MTENPYFSHEYTDRFEALPAEERINARLSGSQFADFDPEQLKSLDVVKRGTQIENVVDQLVHLHNTFVGQRKSNIGLAANETSDYLSEHVQHAADALMSGDPQSARDHLETIRQTLHDFVHGDNVVDLSGMSREEYHNEILGKDFKESPTYWQMKDMAEIHLPNAIKTFEE